MYMTFPHDDIEQMKMRTKALFRFKNVGSLPAINVTIEYYVKIVEDGQDKFMKSSNTDYPDGQSLPPLAPQESYGVDIPMDKVHLEAMFESITCYFGLIIWYSSPANNEKYQYKMEGHFDRLDIMLHDTSVIT